MRFRFTEEEEAWRAEVTQFCQENVKPEHAINYYRTGIPDDAEFYQKLAQKGWIGLAWEPELGGRGLGHRMMGVFNEEMAYHEAPTGVLGATVGLLGNSLRVFGSEEQKRRLLPLITSGKMTTSELLTEPEAGCDAANAQTTAVLDGDDFVINGVKIFNDGNFPTHAFATTRTDLNAPKHRGITLFLLDMKDPGVNCSPLFTVGHYRRNQLILDNVRVPRENMLGELNRGWYHIAMLLDFERSNTGGPGTMRRNWERLTDFVKEHGLNRKMWVREALADRSREIEASRLMEWWICAMQEEELIPNHEASAAKLYSNSVAALRFAHTSMDILGRYGDLLGQHGELENGWPESEASKRWAPLQGFITKIYRDVRVGNIAGGSNEMMKLIISRRGLDLPR